MLGGAKSPEQHRLNRERAAAVRHRWSRTLATWAIPNLTLAIVILQVAVYVLGYVEPAIAELVAFNREAILSGEVWRLGTFLVEPPTTNLLFLLFFWFCFVGFGTSVEAQFGTVRYNVYLLIGWVASVGAAMLLPGGTVTNAFLYGTVFLAFARLFPETDVHIYMLIPVKAKWLELAALIGYFWAFTVGDATQRLLVVASLANYLSFFGGDAWRRLRSGQRRAAFNAKAASRDRKPFHICQVCGLTDRMDPQMEFRYCSQCVGQRGYCSEHLRNHEHVTDPQAELRQAS